MQRTIIAGITEKRLAQLDAVSDLDAINGVDNYEESLLEVITHHNETPIKGYETKGIHAGITAARLQLVFPDRMLFTKAKKALIAQGKIIERECGQTVVLNLKVNVEPTAPSPVGS
ncbi:MAG: hypothetical protein ABIP85_02015 [Chthoniobacteraceae bacterium]